MGKEEGGSGPPRCKYGDEPVNILFKADKFHLLRWGGNREIKTRVEYQNQ